MGLERSENSEVVLQFPGESGDFYRFNRQPRQAAINRS
jgi:hypothetical protein